MQLKCTANLLANAYSIKVDMRFTIGCRQVPIPQAGVQIPHACAIKFKPTEEYRQWFSKPA